MPEKPEGYRVVPFPLNRRVVIDSARLSHRKHAIQGLIEVDVSEPRRAMRAHRERTGESLSFTAYIAACLARAVEVEPMVNAYRNLWGRLVIFDDVDLTTMIEVESKGRRFPLAHVIRAANRRPYREIHEEIRTVQARQMESVDARQRRFLRPFLLLPAFLRNVFYFFLSRSPHVAKRNIGTVQLTAVGMFGTGGGWGISGSLYTLGVLLGGIAEKPWVVDGQIEVREIMNVTLCFDHDIVDGAPAARFAQRFKELVEGGSGLIEADE